ncbi:hypothetical protein AEAC466_04190 [Asticcacaulis sp. AC466]|uniref:hypothetical protein n=1 Tax=Asticcacaulis sp. AC466 TaxID=1282362 RepID=UPI0003C40338|nr:hypothetical protein [Asticcacaulis sp. AC466]ESQ85503.1 hypothetical protein AEAC466_04190 [Asticcacaulis sp. AC466]
MDDIEDLLSGSPAPVKPTRELPTARRDRLAEQRRLLGGARASEPTYVDEHEALADRLREPGAPPIDMLKRSMTLTNIATLLGREPRRVVGLLKNCPIAGYGSINRNGERTPLYDLRDAINYLATPSTKHIAAWIKSQSPATLPPFINKAFWEAERVKMKVKYEAGDLWHTVQCQKVFGETAKTINEALKLWVERLPGVASMSTEQYNAFQGFVRELQNEIFELMVAKPNEPRMRSYAGDIEDLENEAEIAGDDLVEAE